MVTKAVNAAKEPWPHLRAPLDGADPGRDVCEQLPLGVPVGLVLIGILLFEVKSKRRPTLVFVYRHDR